MSATASNGRCTLRSRSPLPQLRWHSRPASAARSARSSFAGSCSKPTGCCPDCWSVVRVLRQAVMAARTSALSHILNACSKMIWWSWMRTTPSPQPKPTNTPSPPPKPAGSRSPPTGPTCIPVTPSPTAGYPAPNKQPNWAGRAPHRRRLRPRRTRLRAAHLRRISIPIDRRRPRPAAPPPLNLGGSPSSAGAGLPGPPHRPRDPAPYRRAGSHRGPTPRPSLGAVSWGRLETLLEAAIMAADPDGAERAAAAAARERFVRLGCASEHGLKLIIAPRHRR
jgi:hypothetical protein